MKKNNVTGNPKEMQALAEYLKMVSLNATIEMDKHKWDCDQNDDYEIDYLRKIRNCLDNAFDLSEHLLDHYDHKIRKRG